MPSRRYHSDTEWRQRLNDIAEWYLQDRLDYEDIARRLGDSFTTSPGSVKAKLQEWRVLRSQNDFDLMAQCFLHHQSQGVTVAFKRFGKDVPITNITDVINQKPSLTGNAHALPEHIQAVFENPGCGMDPVPWTSSSTYSLPTTGRSRQLTKRPRNDESEDQQQAKRRKEPQRSCAQADQKVTSEDKNDGEDEDAVSDAGSNDDDEEVVDDNGHKHNRSKEREMKRAFAMLQKLSSKHTEATEAVQHAQEVLAASMKDDAASRELKDHTDLGPLHAAALEGDLDNLKLLLEYDANINARGGCGITALHMAAERGHLELVAFLLQRTGVNINARCARGRTPLIYALQKPYRHCALLLLQNDAEVDAVDRDGKTALHYACMEPGMDELVHEIVARDKNLDQEDTRGWTPLHRTLNLCYEGYVTPLLEKGASLNVPSKDGITPFMKACFNNSTGMLLQLLQHKVDLTIKGKKGETALHLLSHQGKHEVIRQILTRTEVDINAKARGGLTPLMLAAANGHKDTVNVLVDGGADLNVRDIDSDTALIMAIAKGHTEVAGILIRRGSSTDPVGHSLLKWKTQVENEHKTEQELSALKSKPTHRHAKPQPTSRASINILMQSEDCSLQQVRQRKTQEVLNLVTELAGLGPLQPTTSEALANNSNAQFPFNSSMSPNLYDMYSNHSNYFNYDFNPGPDLSMNDDL
ncbi:hypothetical protein LTS08_000332 [Lithohypha guttulata]|nr:hypothetical protein LTS08_000332 [Lithohypha guttulata]